MNEFHFDFNAVQGMDYETGLKTLLSQFEDHYNSTQSAPFVFGASKPAAPLVAEPSKPAIPPKVKPDFETITPKTIALKSFNIKAEGERKRLVGVTLTGEGVNDLILPGYDDEPYGAVLSGENGRYNLKGK